MMSREVGVPVSGGLAAFGRRDYAGAIEWLLPLRGKANRMVGSHAQRNYNPRQPMTAGCPGHKEEPKGEQQ